MRLCYVGEMGMFPAVLVVVLLGAHDPAIARTRTAACKTMQNAGSCYWTRGRLGAYNGNPAYRLWKIGTKRVLGVSSAPPAGARDLDNEDPEVPANLRLPAIGESEYGEFEVCPLEPQRPGAMQMACIESVKKLKVEHR
jgi:hypothetical protein